LSGGSHIQWHTTGPLREVDENAAPRSSRTTGLFDGMKLRFTKMHGLGNDFVVLNAIEHPFTLTGTVFEGEIDV
jgi:hypothetical protein